MQHSTVKFDKTKLEKMINIKILKSDLDSGYSLSFAILGINLQTLAKKIFAYFKLSMVNSQMKGSSEIDRISKNCKYWWIMLNKEIQIYTYLPSLFGTFIKHFGSSINCFVTSRLPPLAAKCKAELRWQQVIIIDKI